MSAEVDAMMLSLSAERDQKWSAFAREHCPPKMPSRYRDDLERAFTSGFLAGAIAEFDLRARLEAEAAGT
jgi:hypothetical protein